MQLTLISTVSAATSFDYKDTLKQFSEDIETISEDLSDQTETDTDGVISLPTFQADDEQEGASTIALAIQRFMNFFKLLVAPLAILAIVIAGVKLVTAGRDSEEAATKAKNFIRYAAEGLIIIIIADQIINVIFGPTGEIFRGGQAGAEEYGRKTAQLMEGIYSLIQVIIGSVAIFMIVIAGMRYVAGSASDEQIATAKKQITWALIGLFVVGVSEFVAKDILFQQQGTKIGFDQAKQLFAQVTNFAAGTIGTLSFAFMLYAGYLYVTAQGDEDQVAKAKKIIFGAIIGILLAGSAYAITSTIVQLDASR
ncbi:pilin [Patescibacteria group bacterium]|nr:pilin [Patescibacteria group bacterium]